MLREWDGWIREIAQRSENIFCKLEPKCRFKHYMVLCTLPVVALEYRVLPKSKQKMTMHFDDA